MAVGNRDERDHPTPHTAQELGPLKGELCGGDNPKIDCLRSGWLTTGDSGGAGTRDCRDRKAAGDAGYARFADSFATPSQ
jgi:hypothetical protein